jgi:hypothetical protein
MRSLGQDVNLDGSIESSYISETRFPYNLMIGIREKALQALSGSITLHL